MLIAVLAAAAILVPVLHWPVPADSAFHVPAHVVALFGKYLAMPCWRWRSIWSGAIAASSRSATARSSRSAAGAMGMYLMRQIGDRGVYANPVLPDFMVFLNWKELPWFWLGFDHFGLPR